MNITQFEDIREIKVLWDQLLRDNTNTELFFQMTEHLQSLSLAQHTLIKLPKKAIDLYKRIIPELRREGLFLIDCLQKFLVSDQRVLIFSKDMHQGFIKDIEHLLKEQPIRFTSIKPLLWAALVSTGFKFDANNCYKILKTSKVKRESQTELENLVLNILIVQETIEPILTEWFLSVLIQLRLSTKSAESQKHLECLHRVLSFNREGVSVRLNLLILKYLMILADSLDMNTLTAFFSENSNLVCNCILFIFNQAFGKVQSPNYLDNKDTLSRCFQNLTPVYSKLAKGPQSIFYTIGIPQLLLDSYLMDKVAGYPPVLETFIFQLMLEVVKDMNDSKLKILFFELQFVNILISKIPAVKGGPIETHCLENWHQLWKKISKLKDKKDQVTETIVRYIRFEATDTTSLFACVSYLGRRDQADLEIINMDKVLLELLKHTAKGALFEGVSQLVDTDYPKYINTRVLNSMLAESCDSPQFKKISKFVIKVILYQDAFESLFGSLANSSSLRCAANMFKIVKGITKNPTVTHDSLRKMEASFFPAVKQLVQNLVEVSSNEDVSKFLIELLNTVNLLNLKLEMEFFGRTNFEFLAEVCRKKRFETDMSTYSILVNCIFKTIYRSDSDTINYPEIFPLLFYLILDSVFADYADDFVSQLKVLLMRPINMFLVTSSSTIRIFLDRPNEKNSLAQKELLHMLRNNIGYFSVTPSSLSDVLKKEQFEIFEACLNHSKMPKNSCYFPSKYFIFTMPTVCYDLPDSVFNKKIREYSLLLWFKQVEETGKAVLIDIMWNSLEVFQVYLEGLQLKIKIHGRLFSLSYTPQEWNYLGMSLKSKTNVLVQINQNQVVYKIDKNVNFNRLALGSSIFREGRYIGLMGNVHILKKAIGFSQLNDLKDYYFFKGNMPKDYQNLLSFSPCSKFPICNSSLPPILCRTMNGFNIVESLVSIGGLKALLFLLESKEYNRKTLFVILELVSSIYFESLVCDHFFGMISVYLTKSSVLVNCEQSSLSLHLFQNDLREILMKIANSNSNISPHILDMLDLDNSDPHEWPRGFPGSKNDELQQHKRHLRLIFYQQKLLEVKKFSKDLSNRREKLRDSVDKLGRKMILTSYKNNPSSKKSSIRLQDIVSEIPASIKNTVIESILEIEYPEEIGTDSPYDSRSRAHSESIENCDGFLRMTSERIMIKGTYFGFIEISNEWIHFVSTTNSKPKDNFLIGALEYTQIKANKEWVWHTSEVAEVYPHRFIHRATAFELYLKSGKVLLFNLFEEDKLIESLKVMRHWREFSQGIIVRDSVPRQALSGYTKQWKAGSMSNLEYMLLLNKLAHRSFNDLSQYPVFPWILNNYLDNIDLSSKNHYRDLSFPICAQLSSSKEELSTKFNTWQDIDIAPFHYGSHYSTGGIVSFYLLRIQPYQDQAKAIQGGKFDVADRLFQSLQQAWLSSMSQAGDSKELIPEFFYLPELLGFDNVYYGRTQFDDEVRDVRIPDWAENADDFYVKHRLALESPIVTSSLSNWIDLTFGYKQKGRGAIEFLNIYFYTTYEDPFKALYEEYSRRGKLEQIDEIAQQVYHFGQTPVQIFKSRHSKPESSQKSVCKSFDNDNFTFYDFNYLNIEGRVLGLIMLSNKNLMLLTWKQNRLNLMKAKPTFLNPNAYELNKRPIQIESVFYNEENLDSSCFCFYKEQFLVSGQHFDCSIKLHKLDGSLFKEIYFHSHLVTCVASTSDAFYTGGMDSMIVGWTLIGETLSRCLFLGHREPIKQVAPLPSFCILSSADVNGVIFLHEMRTGEPLAQINSHLPCSLTYSEMGYIIAYSSRVVKIYSVNGRLAKQREFSNDIHGLKTNSFGNLMFVSNYTRTFTAELFSDRHDRLVECMEGKFVSQVFGESFITKNPVILYAVEQDGNTCVSLCTYEERATVEQRQHYIENF